MGFARSASEVATHGRARSGSTLVELLVVLLVLAIVTSLSAFALGGMGTHPDGGAAERFDAARDAAIVSGTAVIRVVDSISGVPALFLPDGQVVGDGAIDPLTGTAQ